MSVGKYLRSNAPKSFASVLLQKSSKKKKEKKIRLLPRANSTG